MKLISTGDMATHIQSLNSVSTVKNQLNSAMLDVSSGEKSNLREFVSGDFNPLASIDRALTLLATYDNSVAEAELMAAGAHSSMEHIAGHVSTMAPNILTAAYLGDATSIDSVATEARSRLDAVVSTLNTRIAGRALFSGVATNAQAITDADQIMLDVNDEIDRQAATTPAEILVVLDNWFDDPGGGFETNTYLGSSTALQEISLNETDSAAVSVTGEDPSFRASLKGLVFASLIGEGIFGSDRTADADALKMSGEILMGADAALTHTQTFIGASQARIEEAKATNTATRFSFEAAQSEIKSVDLYDASVKLSQAEAQLELIYTITARLSHLKLSDYI